MLLIQSDRPQPDLPRISAAPGPTRNSPSATRPPTAAASSCSARRRTPSRSGRSRSWPPRSRPPPRSASPSTSSTRSPRAPGRSSRRELLDTAETNAADALHRCHRALELDGHAHGYTADEWLPVIYDAAGAAARVLAAGPGSTVASSGRPRRRCAGSQARSPASTRILARRRRPSPTRSLACSSCACSPTPPARVPSSDPAPRALPTRCLGMFGSRRVLRPPCLWRTAASRIRRGRSPAFVLGRVSEPATTHDSSCPDRGPGSWVGKPAVMAALHGGR